jgi:adenylosuccinate synthase
VLTGLERIPVCVAYEVDGVRHDEIPMTQTDFHHAKPVYEYLDGWSEDITGVRTFDELPKNAQAYVRTLEEMAGAPISAIGVGPGRDETLQLRSLV